MSRRVLITACLSIVLAVSLAAGSHAETTPGPVGSKAGALVELALNGFGGADSIMATTSIVAHGHADNPATGKPGSFSLYITGDGKFRIDLIFGPETLARTRSGLKSYSSSGGGRLERVEDEDDWRTFFEQKSLGLLFGLLRPYRPEYSGMGFIEGKRYEKLVLYDPAGPALLVVLDKKTGRVKRTFMDTGQGKEGMFEMRFSDFAPEGGLVLPHSISQYVGGRKVLKVKMKEFIFDTELSPRLFKP